MSEESELERLQRQVEKARALIYQSGRKVEKLGESINEIYNSAERFVLFPRNGKRKFPLCADA